MPDCPMEGRKALRSYTWPKHSDAVFVFMSSDEATVPPPLPLSPELTDPDWAGFLCTAVWDVNYRYAGSTNLADPMHGCYLHAESFTLAFGSKQDMLELENRESGFRVARVADRRGISTGSNSRRPKAAFFLKKIFFCHLRHPLIPWPRPGPGGNMRIVGYVLPWVRNAARCSSGGCGKVQGLRARQLALPVPRAAGGGTALERAGAGPRDARGDARRRAAARDAHISTISALRICGGRSTVWRARRSRPRDAAADGVAAQ